MTLALQWRSLAHCLDRFGFRFENIKWNSKQVQRRTINSITIASLEKKRQGCLILFLSLYCLFQLHLQHGASARIFWSPTQCTWQKRQCQGLWWSKLDDLKDVAMFSRAKCMALSMAIQEWHPKSSPFCLFQTAADWQNAELFNCFVPQKHRVFTRISAALRLHLAVHLGSVLGAQRTTRRVGRCYKRPLRCHRHDHQKYQMIMNKYQLWLFSIPCRECHRIDDIWW